MFVLETEVWVATGYKNTVVNDAHGNTIALHPGCDRPIEEITAMSRLIAAAPELLIACKHASRILGQLHGFDSARVYDLVRRAVVKADATEQI